VYDPFDYDLQSSCITIYKLKDGPINDINSTTIKLKNVDELYLPQFLQLPPDLPNGKSEEIWLLGAIEEEQIKNNTISPREWTSQFVNNSKLIFNSDFIPIPSFQNFPKVGYTQTLVNINNNPSMLILGGVTYSSKFKDQAITNCLFKYDYVTNSWSDLSNYTKGKLPPLAGHKSVLINDDELMVLAGFTPLDDKNYTQIGPTDNITDYNYIADIFKLNLTSLEWQNVTTDLNLDEDTYGSGAFFGSSINYKDGKLYIYGDLYNFNTAKFETTFGALDLNELEWKWIDLTNEVNIDYNLALNYHDSLIIGNQLMLIHGK
jgi:hypothetical protein